MSDSAPTNGLWMRAARSRECAALHTLSGSGIHVPSYKDCMEKALLYAEYNRLTQTYAAAVSDVTAKMGVVSKDEYMRLHNFAESCRRDCTNARDRLERHIAEHGC